MLQLFGSSPKNCRTSRKIGGRLDHRTGVGKSAQGFSPTKLAKTTTSISSSAPAHPLKFRLSSLVLAWLLLAAPSAGSAVKYNSNYWVSVISISLDRKISIVCNFDAQCKIALLRVPLGGCPPQIKAKKRLKKTLRSYSKKLEKKSGRKVGKERRNAHAQDSRA